MTMPELGALLARHPVPWWLAGMLLSAGLGGCGLAGLRALRQSPRSPWRWIRAWLWRHPVPPVHARWVLLGAMGVSACTLVLAGATMAGLAESGRPGGPWGALDDAIAAGLRTGAGTGVLRWFAAITHLGDTAVLTALTLAVGALLWVRRHRLLATGWLVAMAGNAVLTRVLKGVFERVRPEHVHGLAQGEGFSFPSGHSSAAMVAYAMLAYLCTRLLPRAWHLPAAAGAGALVFTTGWSRVVLHVHYASDVLAGWLLGATWMVCTVLVVESITRLRAGTTQSLAPGRG